MNLWYILDAQNYCTNPNILKVILYAKIFARIIFTVVPIGLIIMVIIDFAKNVGTNDENIQKQNLRRAAKRILFGVILFLVPYIVNLINSGIGSLGVKYADCLKNANEEYILERTNTLAEELLVLAQEKRTIAAILEASDAINDVTNGQLKNDLQQQLDELKKEVEEEIAQQQKDNNPGQSVITDGKNGFLISVPHPNPDYKGYAIQLTDSQRIKVARSIFGEMESSTYEGYVAFCQYIRDYEDYGHTDKKLDNLGTRWLTRGGTNDKIKNYDISWFEKNKPEVLRAIKYVFDEGNSAFQAVVAGYYSWADVDPAKEYGFDDPYSYMLWVTGHEDHADHHDVWIVNGVGTKAYTGFFVCNPGYGPNATKRNKR